MGRRNAERSIRNALQRGKQDLVLTCGFAGGLRPGLESGTVLYESDDNPDLKKRLDASGALSGQVLFSPRVATTAADKAALWEHSKADAVEMESHAVRAICRQRGIPSATVRVVLDTAAEDLPLDFNRLMTADQKMSYAKLIAVLACSPAKIPALMRLQKQSRATAEKLAEVLLRFLQLDI